ncbi:MAG TPA: hypothetical protein VGB11_06430 [Candidatus Bathyarchaeia archaeon]
MKIGKVIIATALAAVTVALLTASVFAYMSGQRVNSPYGTYTNGAYGTYSGGMMSGMMGNRYAAQSGTSASYAYQYRGGCHGRQSYNSYDGPAYSNNGAAITIDTAVAIAQRYLTSLNNPDLAINEVEEYTQNFYVLFYEKSTGNGAFEMLIDKYTGGIYPEMGPNMMWNTKYGMMNGGMMGWFSGTPIATMPITVDQAKAYAQQFLNANIAGTTVGDVTTFYGYYHIDVLSASGTYGMLSVNGYTGQVWYHNWHGTFIQEIEF